MTYYTGIDVSLRSVSICVVDEKGEVCLEAKVAAEIGAIGERLRRVSSDVKSVGYGSFDAELRDRVGSDEMLACALVPLLDARTVLYKKYLKLDNAVKGLVRVDPICRPLMSIRGVGLVTALTFKAAVDDPTRFKSSRTVAAHFG